jgi:hypothetical protein
LLKIELCERDGRRAGMLRNTWPPVT